MLLRTLTLLLAIVLANACPAFAEFTKCLDSKGRVLLTEAQECPEGLRDGSGIDQGASGNVDGLDGVSGQVISVIDGDTLDILHEGKPLRIRLHGIDAPEKGQAYGNKARQFVQGMAASKLVTVQIFDTDKYGRSVGDVFLPDGSNLNREIVKAGYAWWFKKYSSDASIGALEDEARSAGRGLWRDTNPQPPWEWRAAQRGASTVAPAVAGNYHGNLKSNVFHQSSCEHYNCKNCRKVFGSKEEAVAAGYKPCGRCNP